MFILELKYIKPLAEIDRLLPAHREYLKRNYEAGVFLASGRKKPRTGGIIIAGGCSAAEIQKIYEQDPFVVEGAVTYKVIEFEPSMSTPALEPFLKGLSGQDA